ncbi:MAG: 2-dehydropantoate 2-reductase [Pseudomonadota bacterium]
MDNPRIVVLGAGSIGCFVGLGWLHSGIQVSLIGRSWLIEDLAKHGAVLTDLDGGRWELPRGSAGATVDASVLAEADIILLCVKSTGTLPAAEQIRDNARPGTLVVSFQNGVSNVDALRQALPQMTVIAGMVGFNVAYEEAGHWHKGTSGLLLADAHPALEAVTAGTSGAPWALELVDNMPEVAWGKLLLNLNNALNALSGRTLLDALSDRSYRRVLAASMRETLEILDAANIQPAKVGPMPPAWLPTFVGAPDWFFNTVGLRLQKIDARARSSMADDFANGRPTEIDYLNGEVVRLAERVGRSAPVNSAIVRLVRKAESAGARPWSGPEMLAECGLDG